LFTVHVLNIPKLLYVTSDDIVIYYQIDFVNTQPAWTLPKIFSKDKLADRLIIIDVCFLSHHLYTCWNFLQ